MPSGERPRHRRAGAGPENPERPRIRRPRDQRSGPEDQRDRGFPKAAPGLPYLVVPLSSRGRSFTNSSFGFFSDLVEDVLEHHERWPVPILRSPGSSRG